MVARIYEKTSFIDSSGDGDKLVRTYHFGVVGDQSETVAYSLAFNYFGPYILTSRGILFRGPIRCDSREYNEWDVDVDYIRRPQDIGTWSWDGDGTGTTEHITHGLETISYPPGVAPDHKNAIGVEQGTIKGTDVIVPAGKLNITFTHPSGVMTLNYFKFLSDLVGYYNSAPWLVWQAGEVRFLGPRLNSVVGGGQSPAQCQCVYQFDIQRNRTNFSVGSVTGITKPGWWVSWTQSKYVESTIGGITYPTSVPEFVYTVRVSDKIDFATAFGIS